MDRLATNLAEYGAAASNGSVEALAAAEADDSVCRRETSLLFVLLMLGTRKCRIVLPETNRSSSEAPKS